MGDAVSKKRATCPYCRETYKVRSAEGKHFTCPRCGTHFEVGEAVPSVAPLDADMMICRVALNCGFLTEEQLEKVLTEFELKKQAGEDPDLERMLCDSGMIEKENIPFVNKVHKSLKFRQVQKRFLEIAMARRYISRAEAKEALVLQNTLFREGKDLRLVGALLVQSGKISTEQRGEIVRIQGGGDESGLMDEVELDLSEVLPVMKDDRRVPGSIAVVEDAEPLEQVDLHGCPAFDEDSENKKVPVTDETGRLAEASQMKSASGDDRNHAGVAERIIARAEASGVAERIIARAEGAEQAGVAERIIARKEGAETAGAAEQIIAREEGAETAGAEELNITALEEPEPPASAAAAAEEEDHELSAGPEEEMEREEGSDEVAIEISDDAMEVRLVAPKGFSGTLSVEGIKERLRAEGIVNGIVDDALISGFVFSSAIRSKPFPVAKGKPPVAGEHGSLEYFFDSSYLKTGTLNADGEIDYKDRGELPYVKEGTLLAKITPHIQGENGTDVYGNLVVVEQGRAVKFRCEKGTRLSEDGRDVFAAVDGHPKVALGNRIFVLSEININGDVGYETGHVEFEGNINVNGALQEGFAVRGADITLREISGGEIEATGDLTVAGGITGGRITVHGNVTAKYINRSQVKAYGDVIVQKEIIDSEIENSGICRVDTGKIISSEISSRQGIDALDIGTDMSEPCRLRVGVKDHAAREIEKREQVVAEKRDELRALDEKFEMLDITGKEIHKAIAELAQIQDRSMIEKRELAAEIEKMDAAQAARAERRLKELERDALDADTKINVLFDKNDTVDEEISAVTQQVVAVKDEIWLLKNEVEALSEWASAMVSLPLVKARGTILAGTQVSGAETSLILKENRRNVRIREIVGSGGGEAWVMKIM